MNIEGHGRSSDEQLRALSCKLQVVGVAVVASPQPPLVA
ncbi:hypothetical protein PCH70_11600 [Pseudomonas cichorii JBC1]|nr:hypothetical protein PCH70_11600 [Pseudomonas cichorii JBC1]